MPSTSSPRSSRRFAQCMPMKPAAPVSKTFTAKTSLSRQRQFPLANRRGGVPQRLVNVLRLKVWVRAEDLVMGHSVRHHSHHRRDGNTQPADARYSAHLLCIDRNALELHWRPLSQIILSGPVGRRSEERRVGKECRSGGP